MLKGCNKMIQNAKKYDELIFNASTKLEKTKGIVLLKHMNTRIRKYIHEFVDKLPNITSFSFGFGSNRSIILRYDSKDENINVKELIDLGNHAFSNQDYITCIEIFKKLLTTSNITNSFIYAKIGFSYLKLGKEDEALDYLKVANILNKEQNKGYYLDSLIRQINHINNDKDVEVNMDIEDFTNENINYGIENLNEIAIFILESKMDFNIAKEKFNLSDEDINIIKLIFAKDYYTKEYYDIGDRYFKEVEKSKNKTKRLNKILAEIRKNRNFYKHRNNGKTLVLDLLDQNRS